MSIDIPKFIEADGLSVEEWVTSPRWIGSVIFNVEFIRSLELQVGFDPLPNKQSDEENPYHGGLWGKFTKGKKRQLAQTASWFVEIPGAELI